MLQKSSISKTAEIFFISPTTPHYLMDISRKARLAHTSVKNNIDELIKQGIITKSIEKKASRKFPLYKANRENRLFKKYKLLYNLTAILESGIIEFIEEKLSPKSIILFSLSKCISLLSGRPFFLYNAPLTPTSTILFFPYDNSTTFLFERYVSALVTETLSRLAFLHMSPMSFSSRWGNIFLSFGLKDSIIFATSDFILIRESYILKGFCFLSP